MSLEHYFRDNIIDSSESLAASAPVLTATPVLSFRAGAEKAGWSRDLDDENAPCFMNENGVHEYRYVTTWSDLCKVEGIAPERLPVLGVCSVTLDLAERLEMNGERIEEIPAGTYLWLRTSEEDPATRFADEPAFETVPAPAPRP